MTHEEKKAAVLAKCEGLCPDDDSIHNFSEHLFLKCKKSGDQAAWWDCVAIEYQSHRPVFTVSTVGITNKWNFDIAYRLLGLDKPPATIDRWDSFKAGLRKGIENHMELARSKMSSPRLNEWYEGSVKTCQVLLKEMDVLETGTPPPADTRWERLKAWLESTQEWFKKPKVRGEYDWSDTDKMLTSMSEIMERIEKGEL